MTNKSPYGEIPTGWQIKALKDICVANGGIQTGPFGSQLHHKDYVAIGTPIITVEHLGENRIIHENLPCVIEEDRIRLNRYALQAGDIVFSRVGSVDRRALVREQEDGWLFSGRCLRVRLDRTKVNPSYISWFFGLSAFKEYIRKIAVGATMPSLNTDLLSNIPVIIPPLTHQNKIAEVLDSVESKIDINRRMNQTLEEISQTIFKSWFVDFDPVRAKTEGRDTGLPAEIADLFPDSFEESPLGEIPLGWSISTIGKVLDFCYGKPLKSENRVSGDIPVFGSNGQVGWHDFALVDGPGIVVGRKGNPGIITWSQTSFFPIDTTFYVSPKNDLTNLYYLYFLLKSMNLESLAADSAVPGLNRNIAYLSLFFIPKNELVVEFKRAVEPLFEMANSNCQENRTLEKEKNELLPFLIGGFKR